MKIKRKIIVVHNRSYTKRSRAQQNAQQRHSHRYSLGFSAHVFSRSKFGYLNMYSSTFALVLGLCAAVSMTDASRQLYQAAQCGKAGSLCGASLPNGVKCPKGPGFCESGLFCGWNWSDTDKTTRCMPIPKDCGASGKSCCPGNAIQPITNASAPAPKPVCNDGSYCFYTPTPDASGWSSPPYSSPANLLGTCQKVAPDCGSAAGKACCPSQYHIGVNPPLPNTAQYPGNELCSAAKNLFCQSTADASAPDGFKRTCVTNKPECGKFGKSCCIVTTGVTTNMNCGASWDQPGPKGYCAYPQGSNNTDDLREQLCLACPAPAVVAADPMTYFGCPQM